VKLRFLGALALVDNACKDAAVARGIRTASYEWAMPAELDPRTARMTRFRNATDRTEFRVSALLLAETRANSPLEVLPGPHPFRFDSGGGMMAAAH
jgi:hypothetical protein